MDNQYNIQDELKSMDSSLPVNDSQPVFSVPEGYFDNLAASVLAKIKAQELSASDELQSLSSLVAGLPKQVPYTVPQDYFESNVAALSSLLSDERSPVLNAIGNETPYRVPQGYFENLPDQILTRIAAPKGRVIPLFARTWMRAAVAAAIGGIVFFGGYRLLNNADADQPVATNNQPADTTDRLVAKNEAKPVAQEIKEASTEELDAFIQAVPIHPGKQRKNNTNSTNQSEVSDLLKDVSATEIDAFLEQIPTADDDLLVID